MDMRDKVITGFMCLLSCTTPNDCSECGYECNTAIHVKTPVNMIFDAIDLLKAQEPIEPKVDVDEWRCGNCGHKLEHQELLGENVLFHEQYSYCPQCGQAVKWK